MYDRPLIIDRRPRASSDEDIGSITSLYVSCLHDRHDEPGTCYSRPRRSRAASALVRAPRSCHLHGAADDMRITRRCRDGTSVHAGRLGWASLYSSKQFLSNSYSRVVLYKSLVCELKTHVTIVAPQCFNRLRDHRLETSTPPPAAPYMRRSTRCRLIVRGTSSIFVGATT